MAKNLFIGLFLILGASMSAFEVPIATSQKMISQEQEVVIQNQNPCGA